MLICICIDTCVHVCVCVINGEKIRINMTPMLLFTLVRAIADDICDFEVGRMFA